MMTISRLSALALAAALTTACNESLSLDAATSGDARLLMQRSADTTSTPDSTPEASPRSVREDTVESFRVRVVAVEFLRADGEWTRVNLASSADLDLMALPTESESAQLVASGRVAAGTYTKVRLMIESPRIRFKGDVGFGLGNTLTGGVDYDVIIPSQEQGLRADVTFNVAADSDTDVSLVFDSMQSLGNIAITGTGNVLMSAVIRSR